MNKVERIMNLIKKKNLIKKYREENEDKIKEYRLNNRENFRERMKNYYKLNPNRSKIYYQNNKELINQKRRDRRKNDNIYRMAVNLRGGLRQALTKQNATKRNHTMELVGLTKEQLNEWLHFTERFYIPKEYAESIELEHLMPFAKVDLSTEEGQRQDMNWKNLRHHTFEYNRSKSDRLPTPLERMKQLLLCYLFKYVYLEDNENIETANVIS
jgi:hypothetical protein